jgi:[ribosomal protein S18]-alanine N-acetyltransferase
MTDASNRPEIRKMSAADLDSVLAIAAESPEAPAWKPTGYHAYLMPAPQPPLLRAAFVAVLGEQILGFAAATLLLDQQENRCELDSIAVQPAARRQGLGVALLNAVLDWAASQGAHHLGLEVRSGNAAAIRLYQRLGFRTEGIRPGYYTHPQEDALLLGIPVTVVPKAFPFSTDKDVEG